MHLIQVLDGVLHNDMHCSVCACMRACVCVCVRACACVCVPRTQQHAVVFNSLADPGEEGRSMHPGHSVFTPPPPTAVSTNGIQYQFFGIKV